MCHDSPLKKITSADGAERDAASSGAAFQRAGRQGPLGRHPDGSSAEAWLTLVMTPGLGCAGIHRLLAAIGPPERILAAGAAAVAEVCGRKQAAFALSAPETRARAREQVELARRHGTGIITLDGPEYPLLLRQIPDPPPVLFVKGDPELLSRPGVAVVGARAASSYGLRTTGRLARRLAEAGLVITSGLALGVDAAAHRAALAAGGGTIAVLGCGLDICYPAHNRKLQREIAARGLLVSEYPFGTRADRFRFPARNRIISGISRGVLVVEAGERSGSLITARLALEQGREVFAVPGSIDSGKSRGAHLLLKQGARLVQDEEDVLAELAMPLAPAEADEEGPPAAASLGEREKKVLSLLDAYPQSVEEIKAAAGIGIAELNQALLVLELEGLAEVLPGRRYRRL